IRMMDGARLDFCNVTLTFFTHTPSEKYNGVCYSPFRDNEDPEFGILPTIDELKEDLFLIKNLSKSIRTYGISKNLSEIPRLCEDIGVDCYPGAWISMCKCDNEMEIDNLIKIANENLSHVRGLIVGNEVLLRGDMSEDDLIEYIRRVKSNTTLPVGTAEIWRTWLEHEKLAENVDFILVHIHPYWEGVSVENAAEYVVEKWKEVKAKYPGKDVIIGETGWPTQGDRIGWAIPSEENQRMFLSEFLNLAKENEISYFYFDVFDERWKGKHAEAHWGLYYSNGTLKPLLYDLVPEDAREGIDRPPRTITVTNVTAPLIVYTEGCSPENRFYPSGRMGDIESWQGDPTEVLDELCTESPHSGNTCIRIKWSPGAEGWAGIYWQYPVNNWGDYPGYNISGAKRLEFWARGEKGCEKAEFKVGGIKRPGKPYYDSLNVSTGVIHLTKEWRKYIINLEGANLSMVIGGFCWLTNKNQNPEGCTIYLDDISFTGLSLIFDTGSPANPYPSISGTHNGTITPDKTINVSKLYTYPCEGTGGHAEYVRIWNSTFGMEAYWNGYQNDRHNITFPRSFILFADETYNFTIKTGSYPQIIHTNEFNATGGKITCTEFVDANGNIYNNWIPAIKLY
ncbi:MAG: glycosyl hydrolase family 17 protein, partial [Canidatus Methanoxibalbensis ujae]|nr:glycosyl hydrolase family 17 protein [Candidatus Methanoxibalbensis ujae]